MTIKVAKVVHVWVLKLEEETLVLCYRDKVNCSHVRSGPLDGFSKGS